MSGKALTKDTDAIKRLTVLLIEAAKPERIIMFGSTPAAMPARTAPSTSLW